MTLPADVTRCLGAGSSGRICPMRLDCRRYAQREPAADNRVLSYAAMLCQTARYEMRIAVEKEKT